MTTGRNAARNVRVERIVVHGGSLDGATLDALPATIEAAIRGLAVRSTDPTADAIADSVARQVAQRPGRGSS